MDDPGSTQNLFEEFINRHLNMDVLTDAQFQSKIAELHKFISTLPPDTQRDMWTHHLTETQNDFRLLLPQVLLRSLPIKQAECISLDEARLLMTLAITFVFLHNEM